ncbi:MAG: hypothetical protein ACK5PG_13935 [Lysobacterales bacterium]
MSKAFFFGLLLLPVTSGAADPRIRPDLCPGGARGYFADHPVRSVDFSIFLQPLDDAIETAAAVDDQRFRVRVWRAAVGDLWHVNIEYRELPSAEQLAADSAALEELAGRMSGEFWPAGCIGFPYRLGQR